jgi:exopolysaccharide production protein ExoZ
VVRHHGGLRIALPLPDRSYPAADTALPLRPSSHAIPGLDMLRGCAAVAVLLFHVTGQAFQNQLGSRPIGNAFEFGHSGVDLFFVLSGFIILYIHADDAGRPDRLLAFVWKRTSRVYPAYWVITLTYAGLALAAYAPVDPHRLVHSLLLLPDHRPVIAVAWTLSHELLFYAVVCVWIVAPSIGLPVAALWLAGSVLFLNTTDPRLGFLFSIRHLDFLIGGGVAWAIRREVNIPTGLVGSAGLALFAATAVANTWQLLPDGGLNLAYGVASGLLVWSIVAANLQHRFQQPRFLQKLGAASYSIYLTHLLAFSLVTRVMIRLHVPAVLPPLGSLCLVVMAVGAIGVGFHVMVERPLLLLCRGVSLRVLLKRNRLDAGPLVPDPAKRSLARRVARA